MNKLVLISTFYGILDAIFHPEDDMLNFRWESNGAYPTYKSFCSLVKENSLEHFTAEDAVIG